jgi:hypothetical protein
MPCVIGFSDLEAAAAQSVELARDAIEPDARNEAVHEDAYRRYRSLFDGVEGAPA